MISLDVYIPIGANFQFTLGYVERLAPFRCKNLCFAQPQSHELFRGEM